MSTNDQGGIEQLKQQLAEKNAEIERLRDQVYRLQSELGIRHEYVKREARQVAAIKEASEKLSEAHAMLQKLSESVGDPAWRSVAAADAALKAINEAPG